jgi:hypothetical protein
MAVPWSLNYGERLISGQALKSSLPSINSTANGSTVHVDCDDDNDGGDDCDYDSA